MIPDELSNQEVTHEEPGTNDTVESTEQEAEHGHEAASAQEERQERESRNTINIRMLREEKERYQRERDEYYRRLQELESKKQAQEEKSPYDDSDLVEYRTVKEETNKIRREMAAEMAEWRLKTQFPDLSEVLNNENIQLLNTLEPELAESIAQNQNPYNKAVAAYKAIKRLTAGEPVEKTRAQQNSVKPRAAQSVAPQSESPLAKANAYGNTLNDESRDMIWKEMQSILNN